MNEIEFNDITKKEIALLKNKIQYFEDKIKPYLKKMNNRTFTEEDIDKGAKIEQDLEDLRMTLNEIENHRKNTKYLSYWYTYVLKKHGIIK